MKKGRAGVAVPEDVESIMACGRTLAEDILKGLQEGDIDLADPGVTVETITIEQYLEVRARGLELLQNTDFSAFADAEPVFVLGVSQCDAELAAATLRSYARQDYSPQINATNEAAALLSGFPSDTRLVDALAQVGGEEPGTETPISPFDPDPTGTSADDVLRGDGGDNVIRGKAGDDTISGGGGDDKVIGGGGADRLKGNGGEDTLRGGGGDDDLRGGGGADDLKGGGAADSLKGGGAADKMNGGGGADDLKGGGGDDMMIGGAGNDTMNGGGGSDTFVFSGASGSDRINRFVSGQDQLDIRRASDFDSLDIEQVSGGVMIGFTGGEVLLAGLSVNAISESDFIF